MAKTTQGTKTTLIRVGLSASEYRRVQKISRDGGVSIARLTGDAIREKLLAKPKVESA